MAGTSKSIAPETPHDRLLAILVDTVVGGKYARFARPGARLVMPATGP